MSDYSIKTSHLTKRYGQMNALEDLNLELMQNEIIGLIGANGSGKTTFFKLCTGLEDISDGELKILGGNAWVDMNIASKVVYVMHNPSFAKNEKVWKWIRYYEIMYADFDRVFAEKLLELFGIGLKKSYHGLSQGMKSLLAFVCALATRSPITLMDEPFIGIDIEKRKLVYEILLRDYMEHPRTFVISSHNLSELDTVLSQMVLLHKGSLLFYEDMDTVREMLFCADGSSEVVRSFAASLPEDVLVQTRLGEVRSRVVAKGSTMSSFAQQAQSMGLAVSAVTPEDVCVYLTGENREEQVNELWA